MVWRVDLSETAAADLERLDRVVQRRILAFLRERVAVADDPRQLAKALSGRFAGLWRFRVGDYRLIAEIQGGCLRVLVLDIGHRRDVYR